MPRLVLLCSALRPMSPLWEEDSLPVRWWETQLNLLPANGVQANKQHKPSELDHRRWRALGSVLLLAPLFRVLELLWEQVLVQLLD
jgi:hypothetical protein